MSSLVLRNVQNIILVELHFITQSVSFNKILINKLEEAVFLFFFYYQVANVTGHYMETNLDNKIRSCCSVDYIFTFSESVFLNLLSSCGLMAIQQTISQQCFLWAKRGLFVYPAMFPYLPEHLASRYVMYYMHVLPWYLILMGL